MKHKIICVLIVMLSVMGVLTASAETEYISGISFVCADDFDVCKNMLENKGYSIISEYTMQKNNPAICRLMGYTQTDERKNAITDIITVYDSEPSQSIEYDGIEYNIVNGYKYEHNGSNSMINDPSYDSSDVCIYTTTNPKAGNPITDITEFNHENEGNGWESVDAIEEENATESDEIFLHVKREAGVSATVINSGTLGIIAISGIMLIIGCILTFKRNKNII